MTTTLKRWSQLGLGVALAGGTLAACGSPEPAAEAPETEIAAETPPVEATEPAATETGEGEGGVVITEALTDPVFFL